MLESFAMGCVFMQLKITEKQRYNKHLLFLVMARFLQHGLVGRIKPGLRRLGSTCNSTSYWQHDLGQITYPLCACFIIYQRDKITLPTSEWRGQNKKIDGSSLKTTEQHKC